MKNLISLMVMAIVLMSCGDSVIDKEKEKASESTTVPVNYIATDTTSKVEKSIDEAASTNDYTLDELMGKFKPSEHPDFVKLDNKYTDKPNLYLRKATYESYKKMHAAAKADGINFTIRSATRNFNYQKGIWERKWTGKTKVEGGQDLSKTTPPNAERAKKILLYSSMPGTSRHHWGTDIDLNSFSNKYFESGKGLKEYEWLQANAAQYGFCQSYSPKGAERPHGYEEEKWHWSYLPIAQPLTNLAKAQLKDEMISGFQGAATATEIGVVEKYVLGINPSCK